MSTQRISSRAGHANVAELPRGPRDYPLCRWCGTETPSRRRTFCSPACVDEHLIRTSPARVRALVKERDRGICAVCERDTLQLQHDVELLRRQGEFDEGEFLPFPAEVFAAHEQQAQALLRAAGYGRQLDRHAEMGWGLFWPSHYWEAAHIQAVVEGGGECPLSGYRTLCTPCHREETKALRRRLAAKKHAAS